MRLWTQNGLLLCSQLKFLGTWFLAAVLCCDFCGVRSVATLQLLETPGKVKCPGNIPKNLEKLFLVDVPVMIFVTGPSSQQSPLQSPQLPPKRSDKGDIFRYLGENQHQNLFLLSVNVGMAIEGTILISYPWKWLLASVWPLKGLFQNMGGRLLHCSLLISFRIERQYRVTWK